MNDSEYEVTHIAPDMSTQPSSHTSSTESSPDRSLSFIITQTTDALWHISVVVPSAVVDALYLETLRAQQALLTAPGFKKGAVPIEYIQENYQAIVTNHVKEFLLKFSVLNFLYKTITTSKIVVAGEPRLETMDVKQHHDAHFRFVLDVTPTYNMQEWKYLPFKAPKRKNYKDLDRQVEHFVTHEEELSTRYDIELGLSVGDWVLFSITPVNSHHIPLFEGAAEKFWFKIGSEEIDNPLRTLLLGKRVGDTLYAINQGLQQYLSNQLDVAYMFRIDVIDLLSSAHVSLELLRKHFRIKTKKDMNKKLIEVFSYRNDLSQRRSMVETALKLLMSKHAIEIPAQVILREQRNVLEMVQSNPDYNVYRVQKDFNHRIRQLAEKQAREKLFIDQLAYHENVSVNNQDVKSYLNLLARARTKEFIYFRYEEPTIEGREVPIPAHILKRTCLREKTINYVIFQLTKK